MLNITLKKKKRNTSIKLFVKLDSLVCFNGYKEVTALSVRLKNLY